MCELPDGYRQIEFCRVPLLKQFILKDNEVDLKLTEYQSLLAKRVYILSDIDIFHKRFTVLDETTVHI